MNILKHKSWHVRKKENMASARADEAEYKGWCDEMTEKHQNAESEAKLNNLRSTVGLEDVGASSESMRTRGKVNREYELEKKKDQEKYEKGVGILTGLGQSVLESKSKLWYLEDPSKHKKNSSKKRAFEEREDPLYAHIHSKKATTSKSKKPEKKKKQSVDELRQQRMIRETKERKREEELFAKLKK
uniref:Leukocyte receptor cluster member 1 homolog (Trinotate prediction) n=1 Tax=Myxobolus squamalis TaxID=59785 RepID=A0A6B2G0N5_MYXSQ